MFWLFVCVCVCVCARVRQSVSVQKGGESQLWYSASGKVTWRGGKRGEASEEKKKKAEKGGHAGNSRAVAPPGGCSVPVSCISATLMLTLNADAMGTR